MTTIAGNIVLAVLIIWLAGVTFLVLRFVRHYNRLTKGITHATLHDVLASFIRSQSQMIERVGKGEERQKKLESDVLTHIQKVGLVRFNPFSDTGGSQSFTLALLNGHENGIIMTSLYGRVGNRWYIKEIVGGKGKNIELSKEEMIAVREAQHFSNAL